MTQAHLLGSETRSDGGAIRGCGCYAGETRLPCKMLRVGRQLILRNPPTRAQRCRCTLRTTAQQLAFGRKNKCVRCVRITISSLGRYVVAVVFLRKGTVWPILQEKQAGTVQVVGGCGSVALYARTEGCDLLTIYNQHADVVVTRVVLPDSPLNLFDQLVGKPGKLARGQGAKVFPTEKRPGLILEAGRSQSGRSDAATHRPTVGKGELPPAHLRRAFAANSKYDKIVMSSPHTLGVAYVRLSEVAISFKDRTM